MQASCLDALAENSAAKENKMVESVAFEEAMAVQQEVKCFVVVVVVCFEMFLLEPHSFLLLPRRMFQQAHHFGPVGVHKGWDSQHTLGIGSAL